MNLTFRAGLLSIFVLFMSTAAAQRLEPDIMITKVINAPVADAWKAWTTAEAKP